MTGILLAFLISNGGYDRTLVQIKGWDEGSRVLLTARKIPGRDLDGRPLYLQAQAARAFQDLMESALIAGVELRVTYAHRSYSQQQRLRSESPNKAARPGHSSHQAGVSVDLAGTIQDGRKTRLYRWLVKEAPRFGFVNDVQREPWHWSYKEEEL